VSLRNKEGHNSFAVSDSDLLQGRRGASYEDTRFISEEAEYFLAGVLEGLADGT
jgi:glutamine synthetase